MQSEAVIELKGLHKSFSGGKYTIFRNLNLIVPRRKVLFILGPSGTGKSVMLKHILGLLKPDKGEVLVTGEHIPYGDPVNLARLRKKFGVLFQGAALFDNMTVFENVAFPLVENRRKLSADEIRSKVLEKVKAVGLDPKLTLEKYPNELSGGMRKRVGLARAIVLEPEILLYDEPTTGLDPVTRAMVDDLIVETNTKFQLTSMVISHDIPSAMYSADLMAFLYQGEIVFYGTPDEFKTCSHPIVKQFLESEERRWKA